MAKIQIDPSIISIFHVPDGQPSEATPFQGFAWSLCENSRLLGFVRELPRDIFEFHPDFSAARTARRICGQAPVNWFGQSMKALINPYADRTHPFKVAFFQDDGDANKYKKHIENKNEFAVVVSPKNSQVNFDNLSVEKIRKEFISICDKLNLDGGFEDVDKIRDIISGWKFPDLEELNFKVGGHATVVPNIAALKAAGFEDPTDGPFGASISDAPYVEQIVRTARAVFEKREQILQVPANAIFPRSPDLNIYAPSTYDLKYLTSLKLPSGFGDWDARAALRALERQNGYGFSGTTKQLAGLFKLPSDQGADKPSQNPIISIRQGELWLGTEAIACISGSEVSSVVRLPNKINRTRGMVRQFAQHYRSDKPNAVKSAAMFSKVQRKLGDAVPAEFLELISRSKDGIRIVSDAHLEWLNIDDFPLGLRFDVSRVPVTPGNLFIDQVSNSQIRMVQPKDFEEILVVSGLKSGDIIAKQFEEAFAHFAPIWSKNINPRIVRVSNRKELISAIDEFDGTMMMFDGHGSHKPGNPGHIWLDDEQVDVWSLRGEVDRIPPIVFLSACDTHAADRNHATVANGFLALGATSVIASVFPLHAFHAALFASRLLYRISDFIPAAIQQLGRSLSWLEVVSGMMRRHLVTDILRHFEARKIIEHEISLHHELSAQADFGKGQGLLEVKKTLRRFFESDHDFKRELHHAISVSSMISYIHLGRPERILINTIDNVGSFFGQEVPASSETD